SPGKHTAAVTAPVSGTSVATSVTVNDASKTLNVIQTPSASASSPSISSSKVAEKVRNVKEKKDKGVSLMRRLTNMKKSKSPPPSMYSMDNPVFDDGNSSPSSIIDPVHIRSGSCPSQLLHAGTTQDVKASTIGHHRLHHGREGHVTSSQRVKHKERPSLPVTFFQRSGESSAIASGTMSSHHRKSNSLDAGTGKQVRQQVATRDR
ncbi:hypothetical protein QAD02_014368, partial [Eretmocerus hayati]